MSSLNSTSGFGADSNWLILQAGQGQYQLLTDEDGPGGAPPVASDVMSEEELNAKLAAMNNGQGVGFKLVDGFYVALDGYSGSTGAVHSSVYSYEGHEVPDTSGPVASNTDVSSRVSGLASSAGSQDASLMWLGFMVMAETSMRDVSDAREARTLAQSQKTAFGLREIKATEEKIEKEKEAAAEAVTTAWIVLGVSTLAAAAGGAAAGWAGGAAGEGGKAAAIGYGALGAGAGAIGSGIGPLVQAWRNAVEVESGAKSEANKKELEAKYFSAMAAMIDEAIEDTKSNYDAAKEAFKSALKIIVDHYDQQAQITSKIFQS